jgi:hypothetical protein
MKFFFAILILTLGMQLKAAPYEYGELFFVEENKLEHSKLQILGSMISDNNFIDSYGLIINKSLFTTSLYKLSGEVTFRQTDLTSSIKDADVNTEINQPTSSLHLVSSLLLLKAKSSILNKLYQDLQIYLDVGLGATQYKEHTFSDSTPFSIYGGLSLEIPFEKYSFLAKYRRLSDNFTESEKSNYSEIMLGIGFKW